MNDAPDLRSPDVWPRLIESLDPARLLVLVEHRMGPQLRERCAAEDILQEAFSQAWQGRERFEWRGAKSFRSWILSIIDHRIADERARLGAQKRDARREERGGDADSTGSTGSGEPWAAVLRSTTPSRLASLREEAELLRRTLESLPDELREVVRLRWFEELELEEIAERLTLGVSAVRHRSRKGEVLFAQRLRALRSSRSGAESGDSAALDERDHAP